MTTPVSDPGAAMTALAVPPARSSRGSLVDREADTDKQCPTCGVRFPFEYNLCPTDGTELVEADELVDTTLAGTYVIQRIVGEGGMGRVYEARHTRIASKRFAIKTLHKELSAIPQMLARFEREARAAAAIESPYVVGVFDVGTAPDGRPFIVSEHLDGIDLQAHVEQRGKLPLPLAIHIIRQVCAAVASAHHVGVVHRDLKPENVFLVGESETPTAKVLDFGIAKFDDHESLTRTGVVMGTPSFMAPEQARGERVDERADVYALGAILYCTLTGRPPFEGEDPAGVVVQVLTGRPPRPRSLEPTIPPQLEIIIERAMAADPNERFASAAELEAALSPFSASAEQVAESSRVGLTLGSQADAPADEAPDDRSANAAVLFAGLGCTWLLLALANALVSLVRLKTDEPVTLGVALALCTAATLIVGVPTVLVGRHILRSAWGEARRRGEVVDAIKGPVIAGGAVFGLGSMVLRFSELVLVRGSGAAWAGWDLILLGLAATAAAIRAITQRRGFALSPIAMAGLLTTLILLLFLVVPILRG